MSNAIRGIADCASTRREMTSHDVRPESISTSRGCRRRSIYRTVTAAVLMIALGATATHASIFCAFDYKCRQAGAVKQYIRKTWGIADAGKLSNDTIRALLDASYSGGSPLSYFEIISFFIKADEIYEMIEKEQYSAAEMKAIDGAVNTGFSALLTSVGLGGVGIIANAATAPIVYGLEQFVEQVGKTTLQKHLTAYFIVRKLGVSDQQILDKDDGGFAIAYSDEGWILDVQCDFPECRGNHFRTGGRSLDGNPLTVYGAARALWDAQQQKGSYESDNRAVATQVEALIRGTGCQTPGFASGAACNTGRLGACAAGTWDCARGVVKCVAANRPRAESCGDAIDSDCDGQRDNGCPDGDRDGIPDVRDGCANTPSGATVDSTGCACAQKHCDDHNLCTDDACDEHAACIATYNTASCDDGDACTVGDRCASGVCQPGVSSPCNSNAMRECGEECDGTDDDACPGRCRTDCTCAPAATPTPSEEPSAIGCADGEREGFADQTTFPNIAGCSGGWSVPGIHTANPGLAPGCGVTTADTLTPACARGAGDDGGNPNGGGCAVADLCAYGWHVCESSADITASSPTGCVGATQNGDPPLFFASRQSGTGCGVCATRTGDGPECNNLSCAESCMQSASTANDVFGCGNFGIQAGQATICGATVDLTDCGPIDRYSHSSCCGLNASGSPWSCAEPSGQCEAFVVAKAGPAYGGVLCCRDATGAAVCGNGAREANEQCDGGDNAVCPGRCQTDCTCAPSQHLYVTDDSGPYLWIVDTGTLNTSGPVFLAGLFASPDLTVSPDGLRAYVTSSTYYDLPQSISIVDTSNGTVTGRFEVIRGPGGIAISPDGTRGYVTGSGTPFQTGLAVFDTGTNTRLLLIGLAVPADVGVTPDGSRVYVTDAVGPVTVVDASSDSVLTTIPVTGEQIVIAPNGARAYVSSAAGSVSTIDTLSNSLLGTPIAMDRPAGLAVTPDGSRLYAANYNAGTVSIVDTVSRVVLTTIPVGTHPSAVAITPDGSRAYVTGNPVSVIDVGQGIVVATVPITGGSGIGLTR